MRTALRPDALLRLGDDPAAGKPLVDLVVQIKAVGDDDEGPVTRQLAQNLLGEEDHREALATALGVPEDAQPALVVLDLTHLFEGTFDAQVLVILGHDLDETTTHSLKKDEVLSNVQEATRCARASDQGLQGDDAFLALAVDLLPWAEVLPFGGDGTDAAVAAVGEDDEGVAPEEVGDGVFVIAEVFAIGVFETLVVSL